MPYLLFRYFLASRRESLSKSLGMYFKATPCSLAAWNDEILLSTSLNPKAKTLNAPPFRCSLSGVAPLPRRAGQRQSDAGAASPGSGDHLCVLRAVAQES